MKNPIDTLLRELFPQRALTRARARIALDAMMHYEAATTTHRGKSWRPVPSDADGAAVYRARLTYVVRDMIRNTPFAARARQVVTNNVVGDGIIPKIVAKDATIEAEAMALVSAHLDTTAIDADGRNNLYGLQQLAMGTVFDSGEVLIRRRRRLMSDGLPLPFQIQILEPDFIDAWRSGTLRGGNEIRDGIEYDGIGRRVAYYLHSEHPGATFRTRMRNMSRRVPASEILHIYRQDRPGQMRGVTWLAPVALSLQDLHDHQDAQLMRQKIAACFAAFRVTPDDGNDSANIGDTIIPGRIQNLAPGEDIRFAVPPGVEAYDEFTKAVLRSAAAGIGVTYEALSGDLSGVNFSSARMGRMEMDRNVSSWQWLLMIPQMLQPIGSWFIEAAGIALARQFKPGDITVGWVPPHRALVDPTREIPALRDKVRAGFASRQSVVRELGFDPDEVTREIVRDNEMADEHKLSFDSDARAAKAAVSQNDRVAGGGTQEDRADPNEKDDDNGLE